jgi:hypothetical protein
MEPLLIDLKKSLYENDDSLVNLYIGANYYNNIIKPDRINAFNIEIPIEIINTKIELLDYLENEKKRVASNHKKENDLDKAYLIELERNLDEFLQLIDFLDQSLVKYKRFQTRMVVKGGSFAHSYIFGFPDVDILELPNAQRCYLGFRYAAEPIDYFIAQPDMNSLLKVY